MNLKLLRNQKLLAAIFISQLSIFPVSAQFGAWTKVATNAPHDNMGVMLLLTDGTVICHNSLGSSVGTGWDKLTPNSSGSYINGTWSTIASMHNDRLFFPTQVLPDGKVFAAGGEYGTGATKGEVYDPVANTWTLTGTVTGSQNIYDGNSQILANGTVLVGLQDGTHPSFDDLFYTESTNAWTTAPQAPQNHDEAAWLKLPDGSILFVGIASTNSCRYIPSTNTWVADATVPVALYDNYGEEAGAAIMLPNGKAIFFGATGHNAIYTPSGTTSPGTWVAAPDFPKIGTTSVGQIDAPAAMMPNGKILLAVSPVNTSNNDQFRAPTWFLEYTYTTNTFAQVISALPGLNADSLAGIDCDFTTMLLLPNGSVLLGINQQTISNEYWIYTPTGSTITQGIPTISNVAVTTYPTYKITGKLFNGISEGTGFGDDWQMSTNYPLVRLTNGTNTYYAKTSKWNRIGAIQTDSLADTALFALPASLPSGTYSLTVVVNGFASNPTLFTNVAPLGVTISSKTEVSCNGNATGSATATASGGTFPYTYLWSPGGGTSATKSGLSAGTYNIKVTDNNSNTASASVSITQPTLVRDSISTYTCASHKTKATVGVKGGTSPYTYAWSPGGGTKATMSGLVNGTYTITVKDKNGCSASVVHTFSCAIAPPPHGGEADNDPDNTVLADMVNIYPNPSKGQFTISGLESGMMIEIYDYTGRKISSLESSETVLQLDLTGQSNGIYLLRILSKEGTLVTQKKIVKTQ